MIAAPPVGARALATQGTAGPASSPAMRATIPPTVGDGRQRASTGRWLVDATAGRAMRIGLRAVRGGAVDSRLVRPGVAFFALPGERTDGHRFLVDAIEAGAAALVVSDAAAAAAVEPLATSRDVTLVLVADTARPAGFRQCLAGPVRPADRGRHRLARQDPHQGGGRDVLGERWEVLRTQGNRNNEVGCR